MTLDFQEVTPDAVSYIMKKFNSFSQEKEDRRAKEYFLHKPFKQAITQVIYKNEEIIGFTSYIISKKSMYLAWTYFFPEYRNKGFGEQNLSYREEKARKLDCNRVYCKVKEDNPGSQNFFFKMGFKEVKRELDEIIYEKYI